MCLKIGSSHLALVVAILWGNDDKLLDFGGCYLQTIPFAQFDGLKFIYKFRCGGTSCVISCETMPPCCKARERVLESRPRAWSLDPKVRRRYALHWALRKQRRGLELHSRNNEVSEDFRGGHFKDSGMEWKVSCSLQYFVCLCLACSRCNSWLYE